MKKQKYYFFQQMTISERIISIKSTLPPSVTLVAVSKFHPNEMLQEAYEAGQRVFGESRPQEMAVKHETLAKDIEWHFIGHLQTNKVAMIAPFVSLIHSVDSEKLLNELSKEAQKIGRTIRILLQIHIAKESTKQGFSIGEAVEILDRQAPRGIEIAGLMGMATYTDDKSQIELEFGQLKSLFDSYDRLTILSMGMSEDYTIAIATGSTMVRIGSSIFGSRY